MEALQNLKLTLDQLLRDHDKQEVSLRCASSPLMLDEVDACTHIYTQQNMLHEHISICIYWHIAFSNEAHSVSFSFSFFKFSWYRLETLSIFRPI